MTATSLRPAPLHRIGFWTLPNYSMIALSNALEGCRMANYVTEREVYTWRVLTLDGAAIPVTDVTKIALKSSGSSPARDSARHNAFSPRSTLCLIQQLLACPHVCIFS